MTTRWYTKHIATMCYILASLTCIFLFASFARAQVPGGEVHWDSPVPLPKGLRWSIDESKPEEVLQAFMGIPYRIDGAINEDGDYSYFARPDQIEESPGLNCSGFVLGAFRFMFQSNIPLSHAARDRLADSGDSSSYGEDWDFGWDFILNISEGFPRRFILPGEEEQDIATATGFSPRGYDLHASGTWDELLERLRQGYVYLVSFNKDSRKKGYRMQHYHVGIIHVDQEGVAWIYQTTGGAKRVYRRNLSDPSQREAFLRNFANTGNIRKYILILEVALPAFQ